jgi:hypothetical protein
MIGPGRACQPVDRRRMLAARIQLLRQRDLSDRIARLGPMFEIFHWPPLPFSHPKHAPETR